ncbi:MAG: hypothetical protein ABI151_13015 [Chitinophagaceae bacterium]
MVFTLLFCYLIRKNKQFDHPVISRGIFIGIFLLKIIAGLVYGYIYSQQAFVTSSDAWRVFHASLPEYRLLLHDPLTFLKTSFIFEGDISYSNFTQAGSSYWNILKEVIIVKFEALLDVFSFGNYYVNLVIYSFLVLIGNNLFFRTLGMVFKESPYLNLFAAFLVPSMVFWTSAVYKDGLLFILMAVICYSTMRWMSGNRSFLSWLFILIPALAGLFLLRTYLAALVIPALLAWIIAEKTGVAPLRIYLSVYILGGLAVFLLRPVFDITSLMASWQEAFLQLPANSAMPAKPLASGINGLIKNLPQSLNFAFLRPVLWENKGKQYLLFAFELLVMQLLFVISLFRGFSPDRRQLAFRLFCFCLAFTGCLFLGYTVNIIGALVRYRCIFYPFMFAAMLGKGKRRNSFM